MKLPLTHAFSTFSLALVLAAAAPLAPAQQRDQAAGWAAVLSGTGGGGAGNQLLGGAPPMLGAQASVVARTNQPYDLAVMLLSAGVSNGIPVPIGHSLVSLDLDPFLYLAELRTAYRTTSLGREAMYAFPIPPGRELLGLDLAFQAFSFSYTNPGQVGASNTLLANLGLSPIGDMVFACNWNKTINRSDYLKDANGDRSPIYTNAGANPVRLTITGTKSARVGPLRIVVNGVGVVDIPAGTDIVSVTVDVPAGGKVEFYNADGTNAMTVDWSIAVS